MATYDQDLLASALAGIALAGDGAILGLTLAVWAVRTWLKFRSDSAALKAVRQAPAVPISDLRSLLADEDSPDPICGRLVVVRGLVQAKSSVEGGWKTFKESLLVSPDSGEKGVVVQKTQTGLIRVEFLLVSSFSRPLKKEIVTSFRTVPFVIKEGHWPQSAYVNVNLDDSSHPLPLTTVYHQLHPVRASPYTVFQALFGHGYPVGLLDEEKILPPGKEITAVGLCTLCDGVPEIKSCKQLPYFLSDLTKDQLVVKLATGTKILFWSGMFLSSVSIGILTYAMIRNWGRLKGWRFRRHPNQEQRDSLTGFATDDESGDVPDGELCVICLMRRRRSAFIPCGHLVCCPHCAVMVGCDRDPRCPVCRQSIRNSLRVYDT